MSKLLLCSLATAALVECATSFPSHGSIQRNSSMLSRPIWARDEDFDESDLSFITRLAAVGDSYSAGIGAGSHLGSILNALDPQSGLFIQFNRVSHFVLTFMKIGPVVAMIVRIRIYSILTGGWAIHRSENFSSSPVLER